MVAVEDFGAVILAKHDLALGFLLHATDLELYIHKNR